MWRKSVVLALLLGLALAGSARAQSQFYGELETPTKLVERGFFMGPDFGVLFPVSNKTSIDNLGFITGVTSGYNVNRYLTILALTDFAIFQAGKDLQGGINLFLLNGGLRGEYPLTPRLWPFLRVLGGYFFTTPHLNESTATTSGGAPLFAGVKNHTLDMMFGLGTTYYMDKRHFSIDLAADYVWVRQYPFDAINLSLSLKYTF